MPQRNERVHAHKLSPKGLRRKQQSIYFEPGLHARLDALARHRRVTLSALVNEFLKDAVDPPDGLELQPAEHTS